MFLVPVVCLVPGAQSGEPEGIVDTREGDPRGKDLPFTSSLIHCS